MAKGVRKNITVPGLLAPALKTRSREFGHRTVSPLIVDLVCYDLKSGAPHTITLAIDHDTQAAQDAVDAELAARYRPGQERTGLLVEVVQRLTELRSVARQAEASPALTTHPERITFPSILWPSIELRWRELGYESLSAYVTGLIRYDLLVGGPHLFQAAADRPRQVEQALARDAQATRERNQRRKLFLDHLIERAEGRTLTAAELDAVKSEVARHLLRNIGGRASAIAMPPRAALRRNAKTLSSTRPRQRAD